MSVVSSSFRSRFRASIEAPVAKVFVRTGLSPNALTLIGFGIAVVGAYFASAGSWLVAGIIVAFGAVFDLFDGALARATGKTSNLGAFMDSTFDRAGEAVVYIGIAIGLMATLDTFGAGLATGAMAAAFMVSYTRAKSESLGFSSGTGMASVGFAPREVRTAILVLGLLLGLVEQHSSFDVSLSVPSGQGVVFGSMTSPLLLDLALGLIAVLATVTTIQRILFVYNQSKSTK
jgi:phosphatidylglycerophosphate synthase